MTKKKQGTVARSESFDEFLAKDGLLAETEDAAIKEIIADQIKVAMDKKGLSKTAMAARMKTSRRQLDRLLDPDNGSVTLATLRRAASAVGRNLRVELETVHRLRKLRTSIVQTDALKLAEVEGTLRDADALTTVPWATPVLTKVRPCLERLRRGLEDRDAYRANPLSPAERSLLFEIRFAAALARQDVTAQYEHPTKVGNTSVDFRANLNPPWLVELVSLRMSDASKEATWTDENYYGMTLMTSIGDNRKSPEAEMIRAQERIGEKVYDRKQKQPIKFPIPSGAMHLLMVDARGYQGGLGGRAADWLQISFGPQGISHPSTWFDPGTKKLLPIRGLFEPECPLAAAKTVRERIHFIGFICEKAFGDEEIRDCSIYLGNRSLFDGDDSAKRAIANWPLWRSSLRPKAEEP